MLTRLLTQYFLLASALAAVLSCGTTTTTSRSSLPPPTGYCEMQVERLRSLAIKLEGNIAKAKQSQAEIERLYPDARAELNAMFAKPLAYGWNPNRPLAAEEVDENRLEPTSKLVRFSLLVRDCWWPVPPANVHDTMKRAAWDEAAKPWTVIEKFRGEYARDCSGRYEPHRSLSDAPSITANWQDL